MGDPAQRQVPAVRGVDGDRADEPAAERAPGAQERRRCNTRQRRLLLVCGCGGGGGGGAMQQCNEQRFGWAGDPTAAGHGTTQDWQDLLVARPLRVLRRRRGQRIQRFREGMRHCGA